MQGSTLDLPPPLPLPLPLLPQHLPLPRIMGHTSTA